VVVAVAVQVAVLAVVELAVIELLLVMPCLQVVKQ
jgi:hypothetical protein